ncbi:hypothetical protein ASPWEDRAFT_41269 [Aspergillus wentii DTO 134E9]|uniref:AA9 family lytic polysaccharide monooxygenase n=1 Tax=Aspergillus wentii DTO 134E9 TaxID=1073089 RepID=A0A1L9RM68_ASPWE|nr:uncharacterized protein ASPWEDRAFT_41269 [Aspergillus wentii DTO 134E9]KAI9929518.1 hypothetical protein MW887_000991 [Aspergillus wentii]OJJ36039.1 hypothetical protein ASPWEDRAFT_41269 [Aspergillus wentii DTO 134E9]
MRQFLPASLFTALLSASRVAAHGHVTNIVINGVSYEGFDIGSFPYESDPPAVVAWTTPNTGNGFISGDQLSTDDIICHQNATNAKGHAVVKAGDRVNIQWTAWPDSHHGPVLDYLADCGDSCETVDKTELKFFKIDGVGLVDDSEVPGTWGDDQLIKNNNSWMVEIPKSIAPGNYVLRHELVALHGAEEKGGAQNYPQCFNLQVTGDGTDKPEGTLGTKLYTENDPGLYVNIYSSISSYTLPGPSMYSGATSISQTTSAITSTGTAVTGSAAASASASTTAAAQPTASSSSKPSIIVSSMTSVPIRIPSAPAPSRTPASSAPVSSFATTPVPTPAAPSSSAAGGAQSVYGQCGGVNWKGPKVCADGAKCSSMNPYYYQCHPKSA